MPVQPGIYKHYGGGRYRVLFEAHNSTNGPREGISMVVYVSLTTGRINVRDALEFVGDVTVDGVSVRRFVREDAT